MAWMESIPWQLWNTIIMRPYFVVFFLTYLFGCSLHLGVRRAALFAIVGYLLAWLSEFSSIHNGIPYGYYYYVEATKGKELWLAGIPVMDSMSFVFLAWASHSLALVARSPMLRSRGALYLLETKKIRNSTEVRLLGAFLFMHLDLIIDPVALRGNRWFLGQLYGYPQPGLYFGVPISNFIGWFVVGYLLIWVLQRMDTFLEKRRVKNWSSDRLSWRFVIGPFLYFGILCSTCRSHFQSGSITWRGSAQFLCVPYYHFSVSL